MMGAHMVNANLLPKRTLGPLSRLFVVLASLFLLIVALFTENGAVKCFQCEDCPDAESLPPLKTCTRVTAFDALRDLTIRQNPIPEVAYLAQEAANTRNTGQPPASCFKFSLLRKNEEIVYRGCEYRVLSQSICVNQTVGLEDDYFRICICPEPGCNGAPTVFVPSLLVVTYLAITVSFCNA